MSETKDNDKVDRNTKIKASRKSVVVGMTGGMDSTVAAYLMKKQGYKVYGLHIVTSSNDASVITSRCQENDLNLIKSICDQLEIQFYAVNGFDQYKANVLEYVVSRKLGGQAFSSCMNCHKTKISLLIEKAKLLGADKVATGHLARVTHNQKSKEYSLISSNDIKNDQSALLSSLTQAELSNLILPLSEMKYTDVKRIVTSLGLKDLKIRGEEEVIGDCYESNQSLSDYVKDEVPSDYHENLNIIYYEDDQFICEGQPVYNYYIGQHEPPSDGNFPIDKELEVMQVRALRNTIVLDYKDRWKFKNVRLEKFNSSSNFDISRPLKCYIQFGQAGEKISCLATFKTLNSVVISFDDFIVGTKPIGIVAILYNRDGGNSKVIGQGELWKIGTFYVKDRTVNQDELIVRNPDDETIADDDDDEDNQGSYEEQFEVRFKF